MLDGSCDAYLVFKINLKDMFASAAGADGDEEDWAMPMRNFPRPVARFDTLPGRPERLDLAVVSGSGGTNIVAVSSDRRTVIYDAAAAAEVPCGRELRHCMTNGTTLIPLGTRLYAVATNLRPPTSYSRPSFQALRPPPPSSSRGRWSWHALPAPPRDLYRMGSDRERAFCYVAASLAAGTRVWVSAPDRGTFSFDTARHAWRKEGYWELPFGRRGLVVPDLGLCFGICPRRLCLCAFDVPTSGAGEPPAVRYVWQDESYPRECGDRGFHVRSGSLAYMGGDKFCIAWTIAVEYAGERMMVPSRFALFLMAVKSSGALLVVSQLPPGPESCGC
ncbi:hypothetical protein C2845_PM13G23430 [Panicum miliaceum]|uniref:F-box/kelch-repeat protein n=1 Tax=Panicum miliaceum TaxID=4540 RepID=A0A3L6RMJ6_PANMI|nr:hypothetical protein C2845_PM13G23430 [Panicum miliaceum]